MKSWLEFSKLLWEYKISGAAREDTRVVAGVLSLTRFCRTQRTIFQNKDF